jgi:hypothetical protein
MYFQTRGDFYLQLCQNLELEDGQCYYMLRVKLIDLAVHNMSSGLPVCRL